MPVDAQFSGRAPHPTGEGEQQGGLARPRLPREGNGRAAGEVFFTGPHLGKFREALAGLFGARAKFDAEDRFPTAASAALLYDDPVALRDDPPGTVSPLYLLPGVRVKAAARGL